MTCTVRLYSQSELCRRRGNAGASRLDVSPNIRLEICSFWPFKTNGSWKKVAHMLTVPYMPAFMLQSFSHGLENKSASTPRPSRRLNMHDRAFIDPVSFSGISATLGVLVYYHPVTDFFGHGTWKILFATRLRKMHVVADRKILYFPDILASQSQQHMATGIFLIFYLRARTPLSFPLS